MVAFEGHVIFWNWKQTHNNCKQSLVDWQGSSLLKKLKKREIGASDLAHVACSSRSDTDAIHFEWIGLYLLLFVDVKTGT